MRARKIIEGAAFDPAAVRAASEAFDAAWAEVADGFSASSHDQVREQLARSVIAAVRSDCLDADAIKRAALAALARDYPHHFGSGGSSPAKGVGTPD